MSKLVSMDTAEERENMILDLRGELESLGGWLVSDRELEVVSALLGVAEASNGLESECKSPVPTRTEWTKENVWAPCGICPECKLNSAFSVLLAIDDCGGLLKPHFPSRPVVLPDSLVRAI